MKIRDGLADAMRSGDLRRARAIVDRLRLYGLGPCPPFNYEDLLAFAQRAVPGLDRRAWDAFLFQIDDMESRT